MPALPALPTARVCTSRPESSAAARLSPGTPLTGRRQRRRQWGYPTGGAAPPARRHRLPLPGCLTAQMAGRVAGGVTDSLKRVELAAGRAKGRHTATHVAPAPPDGPPPHPGRASCLSPSRRIKAAHHAALVTILHSSAPLDSPSTLPGTSGGTTRVLHHARPPFAGGARRTSGRHPCAAPRRPNR